MPDQKNGISVVIPYFKGEPYINYTLTQLYASLHISGLRHEVILINDNPEESVEHLRITYPYLIILNNTHNIGIANTRNRGREISIYPYIYFIDQDDGVDDAFFSVAKKYMEKENDMILYNFTKISTAKTGKFYNQFFRLYVKWISEKLLITYGNVFKSPGQVVFRKEIASKFIHTTAMGADDFFLFIDLFANRESKKMTYIHDVLFHYRVHDDNYSKKADFKRSEMECFQAYALIRPEIEKYRKVLTKRHSGDLYIRIISKFIKKLITM